MTDAADLHEEGIALQLELSGSAITYTEPGGAEQTGVALSENFRVAGDDALKDFKVLTSSWTIANWRGAKIVDTEGDGETYVVVEKPNSPAGTKFVGSRPVETS